MQGQAAEGGLSREALELNLIVPELQSQRSGEAQGVQLHRVIAIGDDAGYRGGAAPAVLSLLGLMELHRQLAVIRIGADQLPALRQLTAAAPAQQGSPVLDGAQLQR